MLADATACGNGWRRSADLRLQSRMRTPRHHPGLSAPRGTKARQLCGRIVDEPNDHHPLMTAGVRLHCHGRGHRRAPLPPRRDARPETAFRARPRMIVRALRRRGAGHVSSCGPGSFATPTFEQVDRHRRAMDSARHRQPAHGRCPVAVDGGEPEALPSCGSEPRSACPEAVMVPIICAVNMKRSVTFIWWLSRPGTDGEASWESPRRGAVPFHAILTERRPIEHHGPVRFPPRTSVRPPIRLEGDLATFSICCGGPGSVDARRNVRSMTRRRAARRPWVLRRVTERRHSARTERCGLFRRAGAIDPRSLEDYFAPDGDECCAVPRPSRRGSRGR